MLQLAFNEHKSVIISPDNIWILICQGFSQHIKLNKEHFKGVLFEKGYDDKVTIQVQRDDFTEGGLNPWEEIFPEFTKHINMHVREDLYSNIVLRFSTSTLKEVTAFEIAFMDSMSSYFEYEFVTLCGIPEVILKGRKEDYQKIIISLEFLRKYGLDWWIDKIIPIIEQFILAFEGLPNNEFWSSIYKEDNKSGGPFVTGWISNFFPYIKKKMVENNGHINYENEGVVKKDILEVINVNDLNFEGIKIVSVLIRNPVLGGSKDANFKLDNFSNGIFKVPFKWTYRNKQYNMNFISGLMGIMENENILETEINWVVAKKD
jgi:hypothetical protein